MMATEVTSENFADASTTAEPEQTPITNNSQDVTAGTPKINGEARGDEIRSDTERVDGTVNSADVSVNGGSDTEGTRPETSKASVDGLGHTRTASTIKKPTTFKAVSVNKTFLAAKGVTTGTPIKAGEKGAISTPTVAAPAAALGGPRPRLVAKTGSGLRDSSPRTLAAANGGTSGSAPDGNAVWNKNRPAPPPEQKRITDEELKQQYGIHLATRLQSDDPGRQANWADIDDDDDDWAPESIEWTDGTKISLPQAEEAAPIPPKPEPVTASFPTATEVSKPKSPAPPSASSTVKLGGMSSSSGRGLILKGASEKPTLVAKPPGPPTPVKSPWAPLPPVDKAGPITTETQQSQQQAQPRFSQRDPHGFDAMPPAPAKEIAADDFSRSWREGNSNANRELYNSQSGRYEPVSDNRRGPSRNDAHSRQPAVLQRPLHGDQQGPAEPSAAFQTHRAHGQDGSFGRRRTSSNISGGSGNFGRRMSRGQDMHPPHDMLNARRESLVAVSDSPSSPRNLSPAVQQGQRVPYPHWQARASPALSYASPASAHGQLSQGGISQPPTPAIPIEDEVELQKKIMRESRELARKRRLEEEAKEDADRKERIRLKLLAMGPAPESKKTKKEAPKDDKTVPTQIQARDASSATIPPPKPPVPEVAGEVKQYGLMKVHHPEAVIRSPDTKTLDVRGDAQDNRMNGIQSSLPAEDSHAAVSQHAQEIRQGQNWQNSTQAPAPERYANTWGSSNPHTNQGRNVWGPPSSDRTLGNGTFNPELSRVPEIHGSQQLAPPGPIGPPARSNGQYQNRGREPYSQRPAPIGPPQRQPQGLSQDQQQHRSKTTAAWNSLPEQLAQEDSRAREEQDKMDAARSSAGTEPPLGPVIKDTWRQVDIREDGTRSGVKAVSQKVSDPNMPIGTSAAAAWKDMPAQLQRDDTAERVRADQEYALRRHLENTGMASDGAQPGFKDTWRHVQLDANGIRSDGIGSQSIVNGMANSTTSPLVRGSRFFPSRDVRLEDSGVTFARPGSPSPPPPTMAGHPAYDGDSLRPHVSLPRPPPIVKLPPAPVLAPIGPPPRQITSFAAAVATPVAPTTPNVSMPQQSRQQDLNNRFRNDLPGPKPTAGQIGAGDWQDRINSLVGRKPSPPKAHALAVDSSSKSALELPIAQTLATVSLPGYALDGSLDGIASYESKPMAEICFEEQEMGSLPAIRVPSKAPELAWNPAPTQTKPLPRKLHPANITSVDTVHLFTGSSTTIHIPGMAKPVTIAHKNEPRQKSNPRSRGGRGSALRHASSTHPRGGRSREVSGGFASPSLDHALTSSSPNSSSRGGRGRGGFGSNWSGSRHVSSPNAINA